MLLPYRLPFFSFCLMFLTAITFCPAQNVDSLLRVVSAGGSDTGTINALNECAKAYRNVNPDTSLLFSNRALKLATDARYTKGIIRAQIIRGFWFHRNTQFDSSEKIFNQSIRLAQQSKNIRDEARARASLADMYMETERFTDAMKYYQAAVLLFEKIEEKRPLNSIYANLSHLHMLQGNKQRALEYLRAGLKISFDLQDPSTIAYAQLYIGNFFGETKQYDSSDYYYKAALNYFKEAEMPHPAYAAEVNLGMNCNEQGDFKGAVHYFEDALNGFEKLGDFMSMNNCLINIGAALCNLKKYDAALAYLNKGLKMSMEIKSGENLQAVCKSLSYTYGQKGDYKMAWHFSNRFITIKDSLLSDESKKQIAEMETKYQTEKKTLQIKNLQNEQELRDSELRREKQVRVMILGGLGVVLLLAMLILIGFLNKRKANRLITKQKELVEQQKEEIDRAYDRLHEKNKEVLDSIYYARRIQRALITSERYIESRLKKLN